MHQFELTNEYLNNIIDIIETDDKKQLKTILSNLHPADIAEIMEELNNENAQYIFLLLESEKASDVLAEIDEEERINFIESFPIDVIAQRFFDNMDSDDAADLMGHLSEDQQKEILSHMTDVDQAGDIVDLLHYDEDTAGGLMAKELVSVNENWTILTCLREISRQAEDLDEIYNIYVVNDDGMLKGRLSMKKLISSPTSTKVSSIYHNKIASVTTEEKAETVALTMQKYDLISIPVIDQLGKLVGRITIDDVVDFIKDEADRDIQIISGISQDVESSDSIWDLSKARLPWLIIAIFGGMVSAYMISLYTDQIAIFPATAMFIPVITAMGGNVGIQSCTIVVQGLASNSLSARFTSKNILKVLGGAIINAMVCSSILFGLTLLFNHGNWAMPIAVGVSLFVVIIFASLFGTIFPLILNRMKIDPALATGPFITLTNDIIGLNIYLIIGKIMLTIFA